MLRMRQQEQQQQTGASSWPRISQQRATANRELNRPKKASVQLSVGWLPG
jgi:hypothetical protein